MACKKVLTDHIPDEGLVFKIQDVVYDERKKCD